MYLASNFSCGARGISGYNLHLNACVHTFFNRSRYIRAYRVRNSSDTYKVQAVYYELTIFGNYSFRIVNYLIRKTDSTHRLVLVLQEFSLKIGL